jgi:hypothetical protein
MATVQRPVLSDRARANSPLASWAAVLTALSGAAAFGLGVTTPPRSGPYCTAACVSYPYTDVAAFVPRDYVWMYPAILAALAFVVLMACVHGYTPDGRKTASQIGVCFAVVAAALIAADYFIQLAVMQPSLLDGETAGLSLFSQYNPHGIFIGMEDAGYLMMSVAFLFAGAALVGRSRIERIVHWLFIASGVAAIASLAFLSAVYGKDLEYRFEVVALSIDWSVLIAAGVLLGLRFRSAAPAGPERSRPER